MRRDPIPAASAPTSAEAMRPEFHVRPMRKTDIPAIVEVLNACQKEGWGDEQLWRWKHLERPGFEPDDVYVACVEGKVVGCFHWAVMPVEIEKGLVLPMSFDGDFAVLPEYRGLDAAIRAYMEGERYLASRGALLRGGFTSPDLNAKFYQRRFGYEFASSVTNQYRRFLGPGPLAGRIASLGDRLLARPRVRQALTRPLRIELAIDRFPSCWLELSAMGFVLMAGAAPAAQLHLHVPYRMLTLFAGGGWPGVGVAMRGMLGCRMHLTELVREAPRLAALAMAMVRG